MKNNNLAKKPVKILKPKNGIQYTQGELFENIQQSCGFQNRKVAKSVYESFSGMIQTALKKGYVIPLPGIGKIQVRQTKARMGRNPQTGEVIQIPARRKVRLTPSKMLKQTVL